MREIGVFDNQIDAMAVSLLRQQYAEEIERAIRNAKRTPYDKWFRRQFYRAAAMRKWPEQRRRAFVAWKERG